MKTFRFLSLLVRTNLRASLALRAAFLLQAGFMFLNNLVYFGVWAIFFRRFHDLGGFGMNDMLLSYGIVAAGFGLAVALAGGLRELSNLIVSGGLDGYLTQPKPVLVQALCSHTIAAGWGDLASGLVMIAASRQVTAPHLPFLALAVLLSCCVCVAAGVIFHSAAFWLGPVDSLARTMWEFLIMFSVYPETIFQGPLRVLLFTAIPAAFCGFMPARLAHEPTLANIAGALSGAGGVSCIALVVFARGLRRYESGNQIGAR
jgi:ABC-2 type transport system permease protein